MSSSTSLAKQASFHTDPASFYDFFDTREQAILRTHESREVVPIGQPGKSCETNLFVGFFFDGTRNNYAGSEALSDETFSNVARLFDAYPGQTIAPLVMLGSKGRWPDEDKYPNYFRVYTPGVGTPLAECGDTGAGMDRTLGGAVALYSERRLVWGLVQAINAVHRYFHKVPLITFAEALTITKAVSLDRRGLRDSPRFMKVDGDPESIPANAKAHFQNVLTRLHVALGPHMPDPRTGLPAKVDPGIVKAIYASAFSFSRGATATRAFANWFMAVCDLDARLLNRRGPTLGGFPVTFDFIGLFDTVASVGPASSTLVWHGHGGSADAEVSLRIPEGIPCTHMVAAHEVRRSFPLDSISIDGVLPDGCQEIVFPGVHSDVGGGYRPKEQGRGVESDGSDLLSRIPLAVMYREARLSGVPMKLELAPPLTKRRFLIDARTIASFNAYIGASEAYAQAHPRPEPTRPLRGIMRSQMEIAIRWRLEAAAGMGGLESTRRATQAEANDLLGANAEFMVEIRRFEDWKASRHSAVRCSDRVVRTCMRVESAHVPGLDPERFDEWADVDHFRQGIAPLAPALTILFEGFVHDSRAWFKIAGWESDEVRKGLDEWVKIYEAEQAMNGYASDGYPLRPSFNREEEAWILEYRRTGKVPSMRTKGREPFELGGGYLRFRRIYAGGDKLRITRLPYSNPRLAKDDEVVSVEWSAS